MKEIQLVLCDDPNFWPREGPVTAPGRWCLPRKPLPHYEELLRSGRVSISPYPWDDPEQFRAAARYTEVLVDRVLRELTPRLNALHGLDRNERYWRILIGPWLLYFTEALYDRYRALEPIFQNNSSVKCIGLAEKDFLLLPDFSTTSLDHLLSDHYNLQISTLLAEKLGAQIKRQSRLHTLPKTFSWKNTLRSFEAQVWLVFLRRAEAIIVGGAMPRAASCEFLKQGLGVVYSERLPPVSVGKAQKDPTLRGELFRGWSSQDRFESILASLIEREIPTLYVENFEEWRKCAKNRPLKARTIVSGTSWCGDEMFKILAAEAAANRGAHLCSLQHGGYYGVLAFNCLETHEQKCTDRFYSWGVSKGLWPRADVRPMPSFKLSAALKIGQRKKGAPASRPIVHVSTIHPRVLLRFQSHPAGPQWERVYDDEARFVEALDDKVRQKMIVRVSLNPDFGWNLSEHWQRLAIPFDSAPTFSHHLRSAGLIIVNHPATTILEAFAANAPTLLYWRPGTFLFQPEAEAVFEKLIQAGVLWTTPEAAAHQLNRIGSDATAWWSQTIVQEARKELCEHYARADLAWASIWRTELLAF